MGFSVKKYPVDVGHNQQFIVDFPQGYLTRDDIQVWVDGEADIPGPEGQGTVYRTFVWLDDHTIVVTEPLPTPCTIVIARTVSKENLEISVENTGPVTRTTLTRAFRHLLMNVHELLDGRVDGFFDLEDLNASIAEVSATKVDIERLTDELNERYIGMYATLPLTPAEVNSAGGLGANDWTELPVGILAF